MTLVSVAMASRLTLPHSQQRHSNIAVVRLTKGGTRLEIACYKNKVVAYRSGAETRLDEVLQVDRVFSNVSRGEYASHQEIHQLLGDVTEREAVKEILDKGEMQVASHERSCNYEELLRDVCTIISQRIVHPNTKRPYSAVFIEDSLRAMGLSVRADHSAKKQALFFMREICARQVFPAQRAQIRLRLSGKPTDVERCLTYILDGGAQEVADSVVDIDPERFREVNAQCAANSVLVSVLENAVADTSEGGADAFLGTVACAAPQVAPAAPRRSELRSLRRQQKRAQRADDSD